jgi:glycosyltransferase involved in cell wall biosynthesis
VTAVLVISSDHVGSSMAGPGIRYLWFARELARRGHEVRLVVPFPTDLVEEPFEVVVDNPWHSRRMTKLGAAHDAVVTQRLPVPAVLALARSRTQVVYDFYSPLTIENAAFAQADAQTTAEGRLNQLTLKVALENGDAFACASERQRDLWLGALAGAGRIDPESYRRDPGFRSLVDVVPFGVDPAPPVSQRPVLKGVIPGIGVDDKVVLWGGGIWNWLDPLTVIRAIHRLDRPEVKLFVLGTTRPNPGVPTMAMQGRAMALAEKLDLLGKAVFFNDGWVPYEERGAYLLEADVGVSAHLDELEARFAYRTRLLDCIWAGLPIVTTGGDSLAELVGRHGLGAVVGPEDVAGYATAIGQLLDRGREPFAPAFAAVRDELAWPRSVERLERLLLMPKASPRGTKARVRDRTSYVFLRAQVGFGTHGVRGAGRRLGASVLRAAQGDRSAHP